MKPQESTLGSTPSKLKVALDTLHLDESTFQLRNFSADGCRGTQEKKRSDDHVASLVEALKTSSSLDPLTAWRDRDGKLFVVDGHHRYKAYRKAWEGNPEQLVPVRVLPEGTTKAQARRLALGANRKDKLSMTKAQKTQAAWDLLCTDQELAAMSTRGIARELGTISHETAAKMKKVREKLLEEGPLTDAPLWSDVSRADWENPEGDRDAWRESRIEKLAVDLGGVLRSYGGEDHTIIAEAVGRAIHEVYGFGADVRVYPGEGTDRELHDDDPDY